MELNWTEPALADLDEIYHFIAEDSPEDASAFVLRLVDAVARLEVHPSSGRPVPEADHEAVREIVYGNYRVLYWLHEETRIDVLAVVHGRRKMGSLVPSILNVKDSGYR